MPVPLPATSPISLQARRARPPYQESVLAAAPSHYARFARAMLRTAPWAACERNVCAAQSRHPGPACAALPSVRHAECICHIPPHGAPQGSGVRLRHMTAAMGACGIRVAGCGAASLGYLGPRREKVASPHKAATETETPHASSLWAAAAAAAVVTDPQHETASRTT